MQTPICQKRSYSRISYFRFSKCRPLHSAARGACPLRPLPSRRHCSQPRNCCCCRPKSLTNKDSLHVASWFCPSCLNDPCVVAWVEFCVYLSNGDYGWRPQSSDGHETLKLETEILASSAEIETFVGRETWPRRYNSIVTIAVVQIVFVINCLTVAPPEFGVRRGQGREARGHVAPRPIRRSKALRGEKWEGNPLLSRSFHIGVRGRAAAENDFSAF